MLALFIIKYPHMPQSSRASIGSIVLLVCRPVIASFWLYKAGSHAFNNSSRILQLTESGLGEVNCACARRGGWERASRALAIHNLRLTSAGPSDSAACRRRCGYTYCWKFALENQPGYALLPPTCYKPTDLADWKLFLRLARVTVGLCFRWISVLIRLDALLVKWLLYVGRQDRCANRVTNLPTRAW